MGDKACRGLGQPVLNVTCFWCDESIDPPETVCAKCAEDEAKVDEMRAVMREWDRDGR